MEQNLIDILSPEARKALIQIREAASGDEISCPNSPNKHMDKDRKVAK